MPLSDHERRVLAEIEADLGDLNLPRRWESVRRVFAVIAPLSTLAAGLAFAAVSAFPPVLAAALTGVIGTVVASVATALVISRRGRHPSR